MRKVSSLAMRCTLCLGSRKRCSSNAPTDNWYCHGAGLTHDPENAGLQKALSDAKAAQSKPKGGQGGMFGPEFMAKLHMNPQTRPLLSQPDFMVMLHEMGSNPQNMTKYLGDPRLQQALSVGLGINMMSGDDFKKEQGANGASAAANGSNEADEEESDDEMPVSSFLFSCGE